jgi:hypothetical protein
LEKTSAKNSTALGALGALGGESSQAVIAAVLRRMTNQQEP